MQVILIAVLTYMAGAPALPAFDSFVGSCWAADFSATVRDTHCFEAMYGGAHIRDRHEVVEKGKTIYAGETIYSVEGKDAVFTYLNSLGGVGRGTVTQSGTKLHFKGNMRASPDKLPQAIDSEWQIVDDQHYEVRSLVPSPSSGGAPVLRFTKVK